MSWNNTTSVSSSSNVNHYSALPRHITYAEPRYLEKSSSNNTTRKVQEIKHHIQESLKHFNQVYSTAGKKQLLATAKDITFALQKSSQKLSLLHENTSEVDRLIEEMLEMKHTKSFHKLAIREESPSALWTALTSATNRCYEAVVGFNQKLRFPAAAASEVEEVKDENEEESYIIAYLDYIDRIIEEKIIAPINSGEPHKVLLFISPFLIIPFFIGMFCSQFCRRKEDVILEEMEKHTGRSENAIRPYHDSFLKMTAKIKAHPNYFKIGELIEKDNNIIEWDITYVPEGNISNTPQKYTNRALEINKLDHDQRINHALVEIKQIEKSYKLILHLIDKKPKPAKTIVKKTEETEQVVDHSKPIRESYEKVFKQLFLNNKTFELQSIQNELNLNKIILGCSSKVFNFLDKNQKFNLQFAEIIKIFTGVSPEFKMIKDYHGLIFSIRDPKEITITDEVINKGIALIQNLEKSITDAMNLKVVDESKWETDIKSLQEFKRFSKWEAALQSLFSQYGVLIIDREDQEMVVRFAPFERFKHLFAEESFTILSSCLTSLAPFAYPLAWNSAYTEIICRIPTTLDISGRLDKQSLVDYLKEDTTNASPSIKTPKDTSVSSGEVSSSSSSVEIVVSATETPIRIKRLIKESFELDQKRIQALAEILESLEKLKSIKIPYAKQYLLVRFLEIYKRLTFFQLAKEESRNAQLIRNTLLHYHLFLEGTIDSLCESLLKKTAEYRTPYHFDFRTIEKYTISWSDDDLKFCKTLTESQRNKEFLDSELQAISLKNIIQCCEEFSSLNVPLDCKPIVQSGIVLAIREFLQEDYMSWETKQMIIDKCKSIPGWVIDSQLILSTLGDRIAHGDEQAIFYKHELQIIEQGLPSFMKVVKEF